MADDEASKRPDDSDFKQQRLPAWQPLLTPKWVIGTFFVVGTVFVIIGATITATSLDIKEQSIRYDNLCETTNMTQGKGNPCKVELTLDDDMDAPVYFYYELHNYYQNHRRYVKSRDDEQLRGSLSTSVGACDPVETSTVNKNTKTIVPCGLIANSYFNDTFDVNVCTGDNCKGISWTGKGIAWDTDVEDKFKASGVNFDTSDLYTNVSINGVQQLPAVTDEEFIVWMRTAGLPTFKKLHRKIEQDLVAGQILNITIMNAYPVHPFDGEKHIVLTTTGWLGGKNTFLGWAYIAVGCTCFIMAIVFLLKQIISPRRLGDMRYFHWSAGDKPVDDAN